MLTFVSFAALIALLLTATWWDLRTRRIPRFLSLSGVAVAFALRAPSGGDAILAGALGVLVAVLFSAPLFAAGGLGGGDVKLLGAVGAFLGPGRLVTAILVMALVGGLMAAAIAWHRGLLADSLKHTARLAQRLLPFGDREGTRTLSTPGALAIPYAVPIAIGALVGWLA